jgi:hypothetical protein
MDEELYSSRMREMGFTVIEDIKNLKHDLNKVKDSEYRMDLLDEDFRNYKSKM